MTCQPAAAHLVKPVRERIVGTWGRSEDFPIIHDEFVSSWGSLAFWNLLQSSCKLNGRFDRERERIIRLGLSMKMSITRPKATTVMLTTRPDKTD